MIALRLHQKHVFPLARDQLVQNFHYRSVILAHIRINIVQLYTSLEILLSLVVTSKIVIVLLNNLGIEQDNAENSPDIILLYFRYDLTKTLKYIKRNRQKQTKKFSFWVYFSSFPAQASKHFFVKLPQPEFIKLC